MKSRKSAANAAAAVLLALSAATANGVTGGEQIGDFVWNDLNANGIQDAGETGINGVTVELYLGANTNPFSTQITANGSFYNGHYLFDEPPGTFSGNNFYLKFILLPGYSFSPQDIGDESLDSDANPSGITPHSFFNPGSAPQPNWDAGMYQAVPEPGTFALFGLGAASLLAVRRRKSKAGSLSVR